MTFRQWQVGCSHDRVGLEVGRRTGAHRTAQHRQGTLGVVVREADALLVNGGDTMYLCHWMRESGLADLLPSLRDTVYVGMSAGSLVLTPPASGRVLSTVSRPPLTTARWDC